MIIGIVGKSGSGKSSISKMLSNKYNFDSIIDADKICHAMYNDPDSLAKELLTKQFGKGILTFDDSSYIYDNIVDREKLGKIVFGNKNKMKLLNRIMLPLIEWEIGWLIMEQFRENNNIIFVDGALLLDTKIKEYCDYIIYVEADRKIRLERLIFQRGMKKDIANKMVDAVNINKKYLKGKNVIVVKNNSENFIIDDLEKIYKILDSKNK
jgi:dephospho-CoA kinase